MSTEKKIVNPTGPLDKSAATGRDSENEGSGVMSLSLLVSFVICCYGIARAVSRPQIDLIGPCQPDAAQYLMELVFCSRGVEELVFCSRGVETAAVIAILLSSIVFLMCPTEAPRLRKFVLTVLPFAMAIGFVHVVADLGWGC